MKYLIIYAVIGILHGIWAMKMQRKYHPKAIEWWRMTIVFVINSIGFPITIPWAAINKQLW
jgi:fucose permease